MSLFPEWGIKTPGNDLCLKALAPVQDLGASPKNMEINMKPLSLSRWFTLGALVLTIGGAFSRSANGQTQAVQSADRNVAGPAVGQQLLTAKADAAPFVNLTAVESVATAPTTSVPVPPPPSSSFTWTGFYVGVNIGHGSADATTSVNPLPSAAIFVNLLPQTFNLDPSGPLGGGQLGYNWQHGHFVVGVEADIDAAGIEGNFIESPIIQNNNTPFPGTGANQNRILVHQRTDAISTIRPRIGFAFGRFLLYGTGGLAIAHVGYTADTNFHPVGTENYSVNFSKTQKGWAVGGGAEFAIGGGFSLKGEYLRYDVGSQQSATANPNPPLPPFQVNYTWNTSNANLFRGGVNFKF
jgi:outer membrane immunogenic protein